MEDGRDARRRGRPGRGRVRDELDQERPEKDEKVVEEVEDRVSCGDRQRENTTGLWEARW